KNSRKILGSRVYSLVTTLRWWKCWRTGSWYSETVRSLNLAPRTRSYINQGNFTRGGSLRRLRSLTPQCRNSVVKPALQPFERHNCVCYCDSSSGGCRALG